MSRIKVTAIVCDVCGNRIKDEDIHTVTTVTIKGPDSNINGTFDICIDDRDKVGLAVGVGGNQNRNVPTRSKRGGSRKPWSDDELNKVRDEFALGMSAADIAKDMGRSEKAVQQKIWTLGLKEGANA